MISLDHQFIEIAFYTTTAIGLSAKFYKWFHISKVQNDNLKNLQIKYFLSYFSFMAGFIFQGPYVHQRYNDANMTPEQINNIMSSFNIISAFWGFFIGYFVELIGHKSLIIISAIMLSIHSFLRYIGGYYFFIAASVLLGLSTASNKVVFEDWLADRIQQENLPNESQSIIKENSALINLILTIIMTPISQFLSNKFGTSSTFFASTILFGFSAFLILILMPKLSNSNKKPKLGLFGAFSAIFKYIITSPTFTFSILLDFLYTIFGLLYPPRWLSFHKSFKDEKLPLSKISTTNSISLVNGAQIASALLLFTDFDDSLFLGFFSSFLSLLFMYYKYENKNMVFLGYILESTFDGTVNSCMWTARTTFYPGEIRKHLMGILRVPASFTVTFILQKMKGLDPNYILGLCSLIILLCSIFSFILIFLYRKNKQNGNKVQ